LCKIIYNNLYIFIIFSSTLYVEYFDYKVWVSRFKFIIKTNKLYYDFYYNLKFLILNFKNFSESTASETLRGESFNFNAFYKQHHYIDPNWLQSFGL